MIIHLCWLSGDEFPEYIKKCLDSWKEFLPDYEIWLWDTKHFDINSTPWNGNGSFSRYQVSFNLVNIRRFLKPHFGAQYKRL